MARAAAPGVAPSQFRLDLDLPPEERWVEIAEHFAPKAYIIHNWVYSDPIQRAADTDPESNESGFAIVKKTIDSIRILK